MEAEHNKNNINRILQLNLRRISSFIVRRTAREVLNGSVILYPTETIYGLGCNAFDERAIRRVFKIKERPETKPMLVLVKNRTMVSELAAEIPSVAGELMKRFWPGPLTLIFNAQRGVPRLLTAGTDKIGIRIPGNRFCLQLLAYAGVPIVSTSANISGTKRMSELALLKEILADKVELIVDAGNLPVSLPSTVLDVSEGGVKIVREGKVSKSALKPYL